MQRRKAAVKAKQTLQKPLRKNHYVVEKIVDEKIDEEGVQRYLVKWEGYSEKEMTWEREVSLKNNAALVKYKKDITDAQQKNTPPSPKKVHLELQPSELPKPENIPVVHDKPKEITNKSCSSETHRENSIGYCRPKKYNIYKVGVDTGWRTKTGQGIFKTVHGSRVVYYVYTKKSTKRYINDHYIRKAQRAQISAIKKLQTT